MKNLFKQLENIPLPDKNQQTFIWGAGNTAVLAHQGMLRENLYNEFNVIGYLVYAQQITIERRLRGETVSLI